MDISTGITITASGILAEIVDVTPPASSVVDIDTSHYGTVGGKTFMPGDLIDNGELKVDLALVPGSRFIAGTEYLNTVITFPTPPGGTGNVTWTFDTYVKSSTPATPLEDKMIESVVFKVSGDIVIA